MGAMQVAYRIQLRSDTAANWTAANPTLAQGEPGVEVDTFRMKLGNGVTPWNSLPYSPDDAVETVTASSPLASSGGQNPNISLTGIVAIVNGGTGQSTANTAFNALSPMTTAGDIIYENATPIATRLPIGTTNQVLSVVGGLPTWTTIAAGSGITQLTGDVTAGPGSGSQAATVAAIHGTTVSGTTGTTNVVFSASPTLTGTAIATNLTMSGTLLVPLVEGLASAGTLTLQGGTAASNAAGGVVTINGAAGSNVGSGGAGGNINVNGGLANGDNTANQSGGSIAIVAGTSKGSATGGTATLSSGAGGIGTGTAGATGGTTNINGGTGGAGSATSGNGGGATLKAGSGGNGVAGGTGGLAQLVGGTGGTGSASGGNGGDANVTGGSPASFAGSNGGAVTVASAGGSGTGSGGNGGNITISTGTAGGDNTVNRTGGNLTLSVGHSMGSGSGSAVNITAGVGGIGTATTGAGGGNTNINAGNGGVGSATGGAGGNLTFTAGTGGNSGTPGAGGIIQFFTGPTISATEHMRITNAGEVMLTNADLQINTVGFGLQVKSGANGKIGTVALAAGTATVANTSVTANSRIFLTSQSDGGTPGFLRITAKTAGTSFVITSSNGADTSTVAWNIIESL